MMQRFANIYGCQNWHPAMICWALGAFGVGLTGALKVNTKEDMAENSNMIVLWGANIASQPNTARHIIAARRRGATCRDQTWPSCTSAFIADNSNVVFISTVGLGKTHCAIALGHAACMGGHSVLFTTAVDIINTLAAAQSTGRLKREIARYLKPTLLIIDELGYLPIDKLGADLLFQIISQRYERAPMVISSNHAYKHWSQIFNNDSTLTSAILDRVLHHVDTVVIEGKSFRTKKEIDE